MPNFACELSQHWKILMLLNFKSKHLRRGQSKIRKGKIRQVIRFKTAMMGDNLKAAKLILLKIRLFSIVIV